MDIFKNKWALDYSAPVRRMLLLRLQPQSRMANAKVFRNYSVIEGGKGIMLIEPKANAAQHALLHRLGLHGKLSIGGLVQALEHSKTPSSFSRHLGYGSRLLSVFAKEYLVARFPRLPATSLQLGLQMYLDQGNLSVMARSLGIDYGVMQFGRGVPRLHRPTVGGGGGKEGDSVVYASIYKAILGSLFVEAVCQFDIMIIDCLIGFALLIRVPWLFAPFSIEPSSVAPPLTPPPSANPATP